MVKTVSASSGNVSKTSNIEKLLIILVGVVATLGEQMNAFFSVSSKMYVFISTILTMDLIVKVFLKKKLDNRVFSVYFPPLFIVIIVVIMSVTINRLGDIGSLDFGEIIEKFKPVLFIVFSISLSYYFIQDKKMIDLFFLSYLLSFVFLLPFGKIGDYTTSYRLCGTYSNPNTYALDCILAIFASLYLLRNSSMKIIKWILLAVGSITLLRTGSRGALLSVVFGLIMIFLFTKSIKRKLIFVLLGCIGILSILLLSFEDANGIFARLFEKSYSGNVRLEIWMEYLKNIPRFMWFGLAKEELISIHRYTPHSAYLGVWVNYGIFAFIPYICVWIGLLSKSFKVGQRSGGDYGICVLSAMAFTYVLSGITMENINIRMTWIVISLVVANVFPLRKKVNVVLKNG